MTIQMRNNQHSHQQDYQYHDRQIQQPCDQGVAERTDSSNYLNVVLDAVSGDSEAISHHLEGVDSLIILEYLQKSHCYYLQKKLPEMENLILVLSRNTTLTMAKVLELFFRKFSNELREHIGFEEVHLFPYLEALILDRSLPNGGFRIRDFVASHNHELEDYLSDFVDHLSTTFAELEGMMEFKHFGHHLRGFEMDLRIHAQIEDQVLIPRAILLENQYLGN